MKIAIRVLLVFAVAAFLLPESSKASVVFKPGKKPEYVGPGGVEEELSGDAVDLFQIGQAAENEGNYKRAIKAYKSLVKRHPKDKVAPEALYRAAKLQEQEHNFFGAADSFSAVSRKISRQPAFRGSNRGAVPNWRNLSERKEVEVSWHSGCLGIGSCCDCFRQRGSDCAVRKIYRAGAV